MKDSKLHIMMIVLSLDMGGLERMVIQLIQGLLKKDLRITLVCLEHQGDIAYQLADENIQIITLNKTPGLHFSLAIKIAKLVKSLNIDVIHSHNSVPHFYASLVIPLLFNRIPLIHTKHGRDNPDQSRKVLLNKISSFFTHTIVSVSNDASEVCRDIEGINPKKLAVIENGIDLSPFIDIHRETQLQRMHSGDIRFIHVGRLSHEKNQSLLLAAFALLLKHYPQASLTICGNGNQKAALIEQAKQLTISNSIDFVGAVNDIPQRVASHDAFVLSSITEGLPLAIIEAMAGGLPVISTDVGGVREVLENNVNGYLVPSQDKQALLKALIKACADPLHLQNMGDAAKIFIFANYSLTKMSDKYLSLYQRVTR